MLAYVVVALRQLRDGTGDGGVAMRAFVAISLLLVFLVGPVGALVGGAIETGYRARESNTRLAVSLAETGNAEIVTAEEFANREER